MDQIVNSGHGMIWLLQFFASGEILKKRQSIGQELMNIKQQAENLKNPFFETLFPGTLSKQQNDHKNDFIFNKQFLV